MKQNKNSGPVDPFSGSEFELPGLEQPSVSSSKPAAGAKSAAAKKAKTSTPPEKTPRKRARKSDGSSKKLVRIEDLEQTLREQGSDIDPDTVISYYVPRRRAKLFGAALLRMDKLRLLLLGLILLLAILFIIAFTQEKMGNFTINLNRLEMYRKGIAMSADPNFTAPTARLRASSVEDATNISMSDLPENLDDIDGDHNGKNYMAYTYYVRNAGKENTGYIATLSLESSTKGAENAVRVAVWRNGERIVYAEPSADGTPEEGCENFVSRNLACVYSEPEFLVGNVDKYTIVIWMEGDDPECTDDIVGGNIQFTMNINADDDDDSSLFAKFVQDIRDTLSGNGAIGASSSDDVPDYYKDHEVNWYNRRNQ